MRTRRRRPGTGTIGLLGAAVAALGLLGPVGAVLGAGQAAGAALPAGRHRAARVTGTADVAYAGSLQLLDESVIGPGFAKATGAAYEGRGAGAIGLAQEIKAGEITPNVFESVGAAPIRLLEPRYTRWFLQVAASPIVLAYNPKSRFAPELRAIAAHKRPVRDLFGLLERPGFLLGRTNPATDPQGQAFAEMVELAIHRFHLGTSAFGRILGSLTTSPEIFAETALEARLQSGQLDAASAFLPQAVQLHLPFVRLPAAIDLGSPRLAAAYAKARLHVTGLGEVHGVPLVIDLTTLGRTDPAAAAAFVAYQLAPAARSAFRRAGYQLLAPTLHGDLAAVPGTVRAALHQAAPR